jgi:hypothetical protein
VGVNSSADIPNVFILIFVLQIKRGKKGKRKEGKRFNKRE